MSINRFSWAVEPKTGGERFWLGISLALCTLLLLLDQLTKIIVEQYFVLHESRPINSVFALTFVQNRGAAWSLLTGYGGVLVAVGLIVLGAALYFLRYLAEGYVERYWAIFMIISGILGNSIDRIWRGAVVDFLDFHYQSWHWPVFNVADISICIGVGIFILSSLLRKPKTPPKKADV